MNKHDRKAKSAIVFLRRSSVYIGAVVAGSAAGAIAAPYSATEAIAHSVAAAGALLLIREWLRR